MLVLPGFLFVENPPSIQTPSVGQQSIAGQSRVNYLELDTSNSQNSSDQQLSNDSQAYWLNLANNAWNYFLPGEGVDPNTGLHSNTLGSNEFTDWDLGSYVQAIVDADKLGLSNPQGWDADSRLNMVLTFLEQRPLIDDPGKPDNGMPYVWYSSQFLEDTDQYQNIGNDTQVAWDAGNLLLALKNVEDYGPTSYLTPRINEIVYNITNYEPEAQTAASVVNGEPDVYSYYLALGFASFFDNFTWPDGFVANYTSEAETILNNIVTSPQVPLDQTYGVPLPEANILLEPLILSIFNVQNPDPTLLNLTKEVYLAQEARYNATGNYTAFTEGGVSEAEANSYSGYVYEWVVNSDGETWYEQITPNCGTLDAPIIYLKAAVSFLALYDTPYAQNMVNYLIANTPEPVYGYYSGVDENGQLDIDLADKTNSIIISAARYALDNNVTVTPPPPPSPAPTPYPTPTPTPTPTPFPSSPIFTPTPIPTAITTPTPTSLPTSTPTPTPISLPTSTPTPTPTPNPSPTPTPNPTATLAVSCQTFSTYSNFKVEINGSLVADGKGISDVQLLFLCSDNGGKSWNDLSSPITDNNGNFNAVWVPSVPCNCLLKAVWTGDFDCSGVSTTINFAATLFNGQSVFSATSNSTLSGLSFNSADRALSLSVTGPSGANGYVDLYIPKSLVSNVSNLDLYLDGSQQSYSADSQADSWLVYFTYSPSTHQVTVNLGSASSSTVQSQLAELDIIGVTITGITITAVVFVLRKRKIDKNHVY